MKYLPYLLITSFIGCVTPIKHLSYTNCPSNLEIKIATQSQVHEICYRPKGRTDSGNSLWGRKIIGCYIPFLNQIWVSVTNPSVIYHELAHACGIADPKAEGYGPWE